MSLGQLVLDLSLNGSEFTVNLKRADGQLAQFIQRSGEADKVVRRVEQSSRSWGHALRDSVIVLSLIRSAIQNVSDAAFGWQRAIVSVNAEMQRSIQLMRNFSGELDGVKSAQEAIADVNMLMDRAATAPFGLKSITDSFVKLRVAGLDPAKRSLNTLIDSVAAFGGTDQNLERAAVAIQQMAGKGVVSMEELRQQLGESVPMAINAMADALGTSYSELVKQISLGRVKSEPALAAMMDELKLRFEGSAAAMTETWNGAVAQFETSAKRLALAIGGLGSEGYDENGYMKALTSELSKLTELMNSPEIKTAASQFGQALAEMVRSAGEAIRWIVENREAIYDWGRGLLVFYGIVKTFTVANGIADALAGSMTRIARSTRAAGGSFVEMRALLSNLSGSLSGIVSPANSAATAMTRKGNAVNAAKSAAYLLVGAVGALGGPIGIAAAAAAGGAIAFYDYKKSAQEARDAVLALNGAVSSYAQLKVLIDEREAKAREHNKEFDLQYWEREGKYGKQDAKDYWRRYKESLAEIQKLDADILTARNATAEIYGQAEADKRLSIIDKNAKQYSDAYKLNLQNLRKQFEDEAKAAGKEFDRAGFNSAADQLRRINLEDQITDLTEAQSQAQKAVQALTAEREKLGDKFSQKGRQDLETNTKLVVELSDRINQAKEQLDGLGQRSLEKTLVDGAGGGSGANKGTKNPLLQFLDSTSRAAARAGAAIDGVNPKLAELHQLVENMKSSGQAVDPALYERAKQAAAAWGDETEKLKVLKEARNDYEESLKRIDQIQKVVGTKLNKAENDNPWLKASADAQRYREELEELTTAMDGYRVIALAMGDEKLANQISQSAEAIAAARKKIDEYAVEDTAKRMADQTRIIEDGLMTQTERVQAEYQRQMQWARQYYEENKQLLNSNAEAHAAYYNYIEALRRKHERDNENGLQKWVRENSDAAEKYKSLWGQAMDGFVNTVADGLVEGKMQIQDFVKEILKELLKIQIAKAAAGIASMAMGAYTGGASASAGATQAGYTGSQFSNWVAAQPHANGGIMTKWGSAKLKEYANGGIARSPQVAVFGEGSMAEAYVPLPDGRSIPVTLQGQLSGGESGQQAAKMPPVVVNVINQSGQNMNAEQTGQGFNGEQFVVDVMLKAINRPGPVRDAVRSA